MGKKVELALPVDVREDEFELSDNEGNELQANSRGESESDYENEDEGAYLQFHDGKAVSKFRTFLNIIQS